MMIRFFLALLFSISVIIADDSTDFQNRQKILLDIKQIVQKEEEIARSLEKYLLTNYSLPLNINLLYTTDYLGLSVDFISLISNFNDNFNAFSIVDNSISYALKDIVKNDISLKTLYESDTFRKRTYYRNSKIYMVFEDDYAKHLYDLIKRNGSGIDSCTPLNLENSCVYNNHIYVKPTYTTGKITDFLISYHIDRFNTGPIVITSNTALHLTESEFKSIPRGIILYDTKGVKYIKTTDSIEVLK